MTSKQEQRSGDNSTNIQIVNQGLSLEDVRKVAQDVFDANFYHLSNKANEIAKARAEKIIDEFLKKLQQENPSGFAKAEDPDFQYSLFTVQKEYARSGDADLGALLVDLLVDRSKSNQRDLKQIVLNESISTVSKLTPSQLATLAIIFLFRYTETSVDSHERFGEHLDKHALPFIDKFDKSFASLQHLEYSGCGSITPLENKLDNLLLDAYQGLFLKGFERREIEARGISPVLSPRFFMSCLNNSTLYQVSSLNKKSLKEFLGREAISEDDKGKIMVLFDIGKMQGSEVVDKCVSIRPYMNRFFDVWNGSQVRQFTLTSVGMAIGHANIKRFVGEFTDLSIWLE